MLLDQLDWLEKEAHWEMAWLGWVHLALEWRKVEWAPRPSAPGEQASKDSLDLLASVPKESLGWLVLDPQWVTLALTD
jgi:hypothetical protein